jgi:beta propeller repeat protein
MNNGGNQRVIVLRGTILLLILFMLLSFSVAGQEGATIPIIDENQTVVCDNNESFLADGSCNIVENDTLELSEGQMENVTTANESALSEVHDIHVINEEISDDQTFSERTIQPEPNEETSRDDLNWSFTLEGSGTILTPIDPFTQKSPSIYQQNVIWEDWREGLPQIYLYNISNGEEKHLHPDTNFQAHPDIWEDWVVWQNCDEEGYTIRMYNLQTREIFDIAPITGDWVIPHIDEGRIVWYDSLGADLEISCYTINDNSTEILSETGVNPDIWGDTVVWEDYSDQVNWYSHICTYDLISRTKAQITDNPSWQQKPRISGDNVVYVDSGEIHAVNLVTGTDVWLNEGSSGDNPVIYGDLAAFENSSGDGGISVLSLVDGSDLFLDSNDYGVPIFAPDLGAGRIVFVNADNGGDIGLYTFGVPDHPFSAGFTENATSGEVPFSVMFTDSSVGTPSGWQWNFGDGNSSVMQNPVHTYSTPGLYTVALWIFDPTHRDACRKTGLIAAGSPPKADFTSNVSGGPQPQVIQFYDQSGGSPTEWEWDFGDGERSEDQNPVHEYVAAGTYPVSLQVANALGNDTLEKPGAVTILPVCRNEFNFEIPGISVVNNGSTETVVINLSTVSVDYPQPDDKSVIAITPALPGGISSILMFAPPGSGFVDDSNGTISGTFSGLQVCTSEITGSSTCVGDSSCRYNLSFTSDQYPRGSIVASQWRGVTPADEQIETRIAIQNNCDLYKTAYTVRFEKANLNLTGPANLTFGVSSGWLQANGWGDNGTFPVETEPAGGTVYVDGVYRGRSPVTVTGLSDGLHEVNITYAGYYPVNYSVVLTGVRDSVGVMRIGDDGQGDLLPAEFLYHDPGTDMDYFKVSSPKGLSRFSLVTLGKSGNIFQLVYLTLQNAVSGGTAGGGGGGGYGGSGSGVASQEANPVANPTSIQDTGIMPKETKAAVSVDEVPPAAAQSLSPAAENTPAGTGDAMQAGEVPVVNPLPFTMALLKNLSIVFLVFFITIVLYVRWKRSGGGEGNE